MENRFAGFEGLDFLISKHVELGHNEADSNDRKTLGYESMSAVLQLGDDARS